MGPLTFVFGGALKHSPLLLFFVYLLASQVCIAQAPAGAPAGATGLCNDGTYSTTANKRGACRGHKGVKDWYATTKATPAKTSAAPPSSAPAVPTSTSKETTNRSTPASGGGVGKVWLNTTTKAYHCPGTRYYGKTKVGAYMTEAEAKAKGGRPEHGKACQ